MSCTKNNNWIDNCVILFFAKTHYIFFNYYNCYNSCNSFNYKCVLIIHYSNFKKRFYIINFYKFNKAIYR